MSAEQVLAMLRDLAVQLTMGCVRNKLNEHLSKHGDPDAFDFEKATQEGIEAAAKVLRSAADAITRTPFEVSV